MIIFMFIKVMVLSYSMRHMPSSYSISYDVYTFAQTTSLECQHCAAEMAIQRFYSETYYDIYCGRGPQYNHRIILSKHSGSETHKLIQYFLRHSISAGIRLEINHYLFDWIINYQMFLTCSTEVVIYSLLVCALYLKSCFRYCCLVS